MVSRVLRRAAGLLRFRRRCSVRHASLPRRSAPAPPSQEELRQRLFEVGAEAQLTELLQALRGKRVDRREAIALAEHALFEGLLFKHRHFTTFVSGLGRRSAWPQALGMFREMQHQELVPNTIVYNAAIDACRRGHAWRKAVVLLEEMDRRSAKPDIVSYSTAVVACEKASEWAAALSLFSSLRKASVQVDAFGVSAALSACGKGGLWALALDMLAEMSDKSVTPDLFCLNGALSALGRAQLWEETLQHLQMLQSAEGVAPDAVSYNTAISASAESSRWPIALSLFQEMQERDVVPTTISFNAVISALMADTQDQAAAVEAVFAQMLEAKIGPDGKTFCVMIGAQGSGLHWQRAVDLLQEMHRNSLAHGEHDGDARQQVAEILVRSDKRELSQDVIRQAVADGVFKTLSQPEH